MFFFFKYTNNNSTLFENIACPFHCHYVHKLILNLLFSFQGNWKMLQTIIVFTSNLLQYPWKRCCLIECVQFGRRVWRLDLERGANQNTASNRHSAIPMPLCPTPSYLIGKPERSCKSGTEREREQKREKVTHSYPFNQNKVIHRKL